MLRKIFMNNLFQNSRAQKTFLLIVIVFVVNIRFAEAQTLEDRINKILSQMTLQEKIDQLHQDGSFNTADNTRLGIPGFIMSDGPHGVRDGMATAFPVGIAMAATWDPTLTKMIGKAMGEEFWGKGKNQALGPCMDINHDPRNGRSPECGGEDPYLDAQITTSVVEGIQSTPVIATIKHYNGVNRQTNRTSNDDIVTQRNLMEEYGLNFRNAIQVGGALCVMNAYNLIDGEKCAENYNLLTNILRKHWGYPYYVVSDWGSIWDPAKAINAGCNLEMGSTLYQDNLFNLVVDGTVPDSIIDNAVRNVLRTKIMAGMLDYYPQGDPDLVNSIDHQKLCLLAGKECMVLLKNQDNILPLSQDTIKTIGLIGPSAAVAQIDGTGSSYVTPFYTVTPQEGIQDLIGTNKVLYAKGCDINSADTSGFSAALNIAKNSDVIVFFGGLDPSQEGEGLDRVGDSIDLPGQQQKLIQELAAVNKNIIVVLYSGGICGAHSFINKIKGLIYAFYPGQEGGNAIAQVLFGLYNPGGKLPLTMPQTTSQLPPRDDNFDNDFGCGYRWFDKMNLKPEFAFGFGLSYTTFSFGNLKITPSSVPAGQIIKISVDVTNTGSIAGDEVAELYLSDTTSAIDMPVQQLKGFKRITLGPGQTETVTFQISPDELYYFDEGADAYKVDINKYIVRVGGSSDNLPLSGTFQVTQAAPKPDLKIGNIRMVPPYPLPGDSVMFLATILNRGTGPSPEGTSHEVTFSLNGNPISKSIEFTHSIPAGGMALVCGGVGINRTNTWTADSPGNYTVEASVNSDGAISETVDTNNTAYTTLKVYNTPPVDLALNKPVMVSSVEASGLEGKYAVDGNLSTRWSSQFSDPQYIIIDLQSIQDFNEVILHWETAYAKEYEVQVSNDDVNWSTLSHVTDGNGGTEKINVDASARYVRIYGIQRATQWGYSLYEIEIYNDKSVSSIESKKIDTLPSELTLENNYPNPFNPSTTINYELAKSGFVKLEIYNSIGQLVKILENKFHNPGSYSIVWNGKDDKGNTMPSGIYFYRISSVGTTLIKKMILLK
jgi:beta-glucosidase